MDSASKEGCLEEPTFQLGLNLDYDLKIWTYRDGEERASRQRGFVSKPSEARGEESWGEEACKASRGAWRTTIDTGSGPWIHLRVWEGGGLWGAPGQGSRKFPQGGNKPVSTLGLASTDG